MPEDTKRLIAEAFRQAASEKSVSRITVQDIASRAGISRHTFYYRVCLGVDGRVVKRHVGVGNSQETR